MANPYNTQPTPPSWQPMPPPASRPAPKWARKRFVLPALALTLFLGVGIGAA